MRSLGKRVYGETRIEGSNPSVSVSPIRKENVCVSAVIIHTYSASVLSTSTSGSDPNG
jgi:hypothetical protein